MAFTFSQMNPDFSGAYLAIADDDITTATLFDSKAVMSEWIINQLEIVGAEKVTTTVLGSDGSIDERLISKKATYTIDEDCYKFGPIEPVLSDNIRVQYEKDYSFA